MANITFKSVLLVSASVLPFLAMAADTYRVIDIPNPDDDIFAVKNAGILFGSNRVYAPPKRSFFSESTGRIDFTGSFVPNSMNDQGMLIGASSSEPNKVAIWNTPTSAPTIITLPVNIFAPEQFINNAGTAIIAGTHDYQAYTLNLASGQFAPLTTNSPQNGITALNNNGTLIGSNSLGEFIGNPATGYRTLRDQNSGIFCNAMAVDNNDAVAGKTADSRPCYWATGASIGITLRGIMGPGPIFPIPYTMGAAVGIDSQNIYGNLTANGSEPYTPVIWNRNNLNATPTLLNSLIEPNNQMFTATQIIASNSNGVIAARANSINGTNRLVLLQPVPEPGTLVVFGIGIVTLLRRRAKNNHKAMEQNHQPSFNTTKERQPEILSL